MSPKFFVCLLFSHCLLSSCFLSKVQCVLKPRGVPLSRKIFYDASQNFSCLDGSGVFPFHFVNDDFCDCQDGSDEPGTAACPDGIFVCLNHGHITVSLPSSRVNDGICDCCDTSDEYLSSTDCFDSCKVQGMQALKAAKVVYDVYMKGNETRQEYIYEAKIQKEKYTNKLNKLLEEEVGALKIKLEKQDSKEKAEEKERIYLGLQKQVRQEQEKKQAAKINLMQQHKEQDELDARNAFFELDVNKDGKITFSEIKSFPKFDYDGDGEVSEMEVKFYMQKKEELTLNEFLQNGWRSMKPAFIFEELTMNGDYRVPNPQAAASIPLNDAKKNMVITETTSKINDQEKNAAFEEAAIRRKEYADADKVLRDVQEDIWLLKKKLNGDYGYDDEFFVLQDSCFDFSDKRYLYRICPFDRVLQIMKHNKDETLLGLWNAWAGLENNYSHMSYTRGSTCWNGPARSVLVSLHCGIENKVLSVIENSPCMYLFEFATPASCKSLPSDVENVFKNHVISL